MSLSPDESRFTACAVGESLPEELTAFHQALEQDPALRREAEALRRTARHLAAALKQEAPVMLTMAQRQAVLESGGAVSVTKKPAWWGPTFATAGIAAAVAVGAFLLPAPPEAPAPSAVISPGIPAVSIQPTSAAMTGQKPALPPPSVVTGSGLPVTMPDTPRPASPPVPHPAGTMAAVPPVLDVPPLPPAAKESPFNPSGPPVRSAPGHLAPGEALGSGPPR